MQTTCQRVGDRWKLAVEFEIRDDQPRDWSEARGSLWLWVGGCLVGNPNATEMIMIALDSLRGTARDSRDMASSLLFGYSSKESLDAVMWARYGMEDQPPTRMPKAEDEKLVAVEVLPRRTGPSFDGWEAILLKDGELERFIYRREHEETAAAAWPRGTFGSVLGEARAAFERLAKSIFLR
jgi:hypothetical protein